MSAPKDDLNEYEQYFKGFKMYFRTKMFGKGYTVCVYLFYIHKLVNINFVRSELTDFTFTFNAKFPKCFIRVNKLDK